MDEDKALQILSASPKEFAKYPCLNVLLALKHRYVFVKIKLLMMCHGSGYQNVRFKMKHV